MFPEFSHTWLTLYSTGDDKSCLKTGLFVAAVRLPSLRQKKYQLDQSFDAPLLTSVDYRYP